jgi:hypothetical protein
MGYFSPKRMFPLANWQRFVGRVFLRACVWRTIGAAQTLGPLGRKPQPALATPIGAIDRPDGGDLRPHSWMRQFLGLDGRARTVFGGAIAHPSKGHARIPDATCLRQEINVVDSANSTVENL